uniref:Uncharacterized protein n=1 Tax=Equus caballus TaxID=9796 RepID=A0A9L0T209_HORSE
QDPFVSPLQSTASKTSITQQRLHYSVSPGHWREPHISTYEVSGLEHTEEAKQGRAQDPGPPTVVSEPAAPSPRELGGQQWRCVYNSGQPAVAAPVATGSGAAVEVKLCDLRPPAATQSLVAAAEVHTGLQHPNWSGACSHKVTGNSRGSAPQTSGVLYQIFKKDLIPIFLKLFQKIKEANIMLILKPDKDNTKQENYRPILLMNIDAKILNKNISKSNTTIHKRITHHNQVGFTSGMQGWFNICKSINVIHHTNKMKNKKIT